MSQRTIDLAVEINKIIALGDSGEVDQQTIADTLEGIEGMLEDKFDATMSVIRQFEANKKACKEEAARLTERSKHWDRQANQLKKYLLECLQATGRKSFKTVTNTFSIRAGGLTLVIVDVDQLPDDYVTSRTEIIHDVDNESIKKILTENLKAIEAMRANGEEPTPEQLNLVPGARLDRGESSLSVR